MFTAQGNAAQVVQALKEERVIPDVVPDSFTPEIFFSVSWTSNGEEIVKPGTKIARDLTVQEPEIKIHPPSPPHANATYTLVMTDPDAPSRADPKYGQWRHWVLPGVKLSEGGGTLAVKAKAATTPYYPPAPPAGSGFHRYIFLLFREPAGGLNIPDGAVEHNGEPASRRNWNAMKFAHDHGLELVGANFLLTEVTA